jgi:hypothetical protein
MKWQTNIIKKEGLALLLFFFCITTSIAQNAFTWDDFVEEITSSQESENEEGLLSYLEELKDLHEHPININTATIEDFKQLPFLSEQQIESIHAYIYLHGQMQTLGELLMLPLIDGQTYRWLHLFVYAEEVKKEQKSNLFYHLKNDFSSRVDIPLYYRKGYSVANGYAGNPIYHRMKYELGNSKHFRVGFHVEKDAGERFYDSYGGFALL